MARASRYLDFGHQRRRDWWRLRRELELASESHGLRARVHRPDFGFVGVTLIAHVPPNRVFLIAPWAVLVVAWLGHVGWMLIRGKRPGTTVQPIDR